MFTKTYIDRPIFVIGNPRSGTSLLRLMLTNHPEICIAPECGFLQWWYDRYFNWGLNDSRNEDKVDEFIKNFSQSRKIETWNISYQKLRNRIIEEQPRSYAELVSLPYLEYADNKQIGREHVCTHVTNAHLVCRLLLE